MSPNLLACNDMSANNTRFGKMKGETLLWDKLVGKYILRLCNYEFQMYVIIKLEL